MDSVNFGWRVEAYPKKAIAQDQMTAFDQLTMTGGEPSSSGSNKDSAGRIPTNPAARGIFRDTKTSLISSPKMRVGLRTVPVAVAVVCRTTFSCGVKCLENVREIRKPSSAD